MKFKKFCKALLVSALSGGVILGVSSCVRSYSVGYIYVTGTVTAQATGDGIISGYKIDHNTGFLTPINGMPVSSGGANPGRAVLVQSSRFFYVLNQGLNAQGGTTCTAANPCLNSNITAFAVGGNGILTPQGTPYYTQGINPFRLIADTTGNYLMALDQEAPSNAVCSLALGSSATTCADITIFQVNQNTGRLTLVPNAQLSSASGASINYFPVPSNPIDFVLASTTIFTLYGTPATGDYVYPYTYSSSTGQLTETQNSPQPLNIAQATALVSSNGVLYVLDNEAPNPNPNKATSQILPFVPIVNGSLEAQTGGAIADDPDLSNPIYLLVESKGKFLYVANQGNNTLGVNANSGIAGYFITTTPSWATKPLSPQTYGTGSGPQCLVEDPSDQFIYTANFNDSSITGRAIDVNDGVLNPLNVANSYKLPGQANWCLVDGRTD
jgi:6-phosphogluconolactonase (cycloisomerase 2 family)